MIYKYDTRIFGGEAYVKVVDFKCMFEMEKKEFAELEESKKEQVALAKKMLTERDNRFDAERKEHLDRIKKWNTLFDEFEDMRAKYEMLKEKYKTAKDTWKTRLDEVKKKYYCLKADYVSESETESESESESESETESESESETESESESESESECDLEGELEEEEEVEVLVLSAVD